MIVRADDRLLPLSAQTAADGLEETPQLSETMKMNVEAPENFSRDIAVYKPVILKNILKSIAYNETDDECDDDFFCGSGACTCMFSVCTCMHMGNWKGNGSGSGTELEMEEERECKGEGEGKTNIVALKTRRDGENEITEIFCHWKSTMGHPQAHLDVKRHSLIRKALQSGYNTTQLCHAIRLN